MSGRLAEAIGLWDSWREWWAEGGSGRETVGKGIRTDRTTCGGRGEGGGWGWREGGGELVG